MTDHERLREQYEDALFALLMEGVAESEGEEALRLNEELKKDPNAEVPKDVQKRCEKTIRSAFAQKQLRATGRTAARWLTKVAVVAVLGGLMFTAAFALSEDVRVATLNALIQVMDDRTQITFSDEQLGETKSETSLNSGSDLEEQFQEYNIGLNWLPEGYVFESGNTVEEGGEDRVSFISPTDGLIEITITPYSLNSVYNVNSENCTRQDITIQGYPAILLTVNEEELRERYSDVSYICSESSIIWIDSSNQAICLVTATNLTEKEMIQLSEGVHWHRKI